MTMFLSLNGPPPMVKCVAEDAVWYVRLWYGTVDMSQAMVKWYVPSVTSHPGSSGPPQCADVCRQPQCSIPYNMCTKVQSTLWTTTCVDTSLCASYHPGQQSIAPLYCHMCCAGRCSVWKCVVPWCRMCGALGATCS